MTQVVVARLDPGPEETRSLRDLLSDAERERADRFRFAHHRRRFIVARARLREFLAARLGVHPERVELEHGANGKPWLAPRFAHTGWRFNVSHCDDVAVYAFSQGKDVGVDVEAIRPVQEADAIAAQFFSDGEREAYAALSPRRRVLGFLRLWTRKEAFVKALGAGFSMPPESVDLSSAPSGWSVRSFFPVPGFIAALARHHG